MVAYEDEPASTAALQRAAGATLVLALMSSTATPESETHGAFLEALSAQVAPESTLLVLVDESPFTARFGTTDAGAQHRRDERRLAWRRFVEACGLRPLFVDLEHGDAPEAAAALSEALDRAPRPAPRGAG